MIPGVQIIEDRNMVDHVEDWSRVRSPSRARRRLRYGHRQNITIKTTPKTNAYSLRGGLVLIMHPVMAAALRREVA